MHQSCAGTDHSVHYFVVETATESVAMLQQTESVVVGSEMKRKYVNQAKEENVSVIIDEWRILQTGDLKPEDIIVRSCL